MVMVRTVMEISEDIRDHEATAKIRLNELKTELGKAYRNIRFECDSCHKAVKVGEATVVQYLEFRCPGQSGGYFVDAQRNMKCPYCEGTTNPHNQPEINAIPNDLFAKIEKVELP